MFCYNCGKEIDDKAVICVHCGVEVKKIQQQNVSKRDNTEYLTSKMGEGVLLGIVLGIIGLIIGILMYPSNTYARKTFIKGWGAVTIICVAIELIICIFYFGLVFSII